MSDDAWEQAFSDAIQDMPIDEDATGAEGSDAIVAVDADPRQTTWGD